MAIRERKGEKWRRGTGKETLHLVAMATRKQLISVCDACLGLYDHPVADKWPNTACGESRILTIVSSSFPFISSDLSVAPALHHNKQQYSNALILKPPDHDTHTCTTHTDTRFTPHILFAFVQNGAGDELKFSNLLKLGESTFC